MEWWHPPACPGWDAAGPGWPWVCRAEGAGVLGVVSRVLGVVPRILGGGPQGTRGGSCSHPRFGGWHGSGARTRSGGHFSILFQQRKRVQPEGVAVHRFRCRSAVCGSGRGCIFVSSLNCRMHRIGRCGPRAGGCTHAHAYYGTPQEPDIRTTDSAVGNNDRAVSATAMHGTMRKQEDGPW